MISTEEILERPLSEIATLLNQIPKEDPSWLRIFRTFAYKRNEIRRMLVHFFISETLTKTAEQAKVLLEEKIEQLKENEKDAMNVLGSIDAEDIEYVVPYAEKRTNALTINEPYISLSLDIITEQMLSNIIETLQTHQKLLTKRINVEKQNITEKVITPFHTFIPTKRKKHSVIIHSKEHIPDYCYTIKKELNYSLLKQELKKRKIEGVELVEENSVQVKENQNNL